MESERRTWSSRGRSWPPTGWKPTRGRRLARSFVVNRHEADCLEGRTNAFVRTLPLAITLVLALALPLDIRSEVTHLSVSARSALEHPDGFTQVNRVKDIPKEVLRVVAEASHDPKFRLADPGQDWQETDVVVKPGLPRRRLVFAASSPQYWLLHYERGGIGHDYHLVLVQVQPGANRIVWRAVMFRAIASHGDIPSALGSKDISDDPKFLF